MLCYQYSYYGLGESHHCGHTCHHLVTVTCVTDDVVTSCGYQQMAKGKRLHNCAESSFKKSEALLCIPESIEVVRLQSILDAWYLP